MEILLDENENIDCEEDFESFNEDEELLTADSPLIHDSTQTFSAIPKLKPVLNNRMSIGEKAGMEGVDKETVNRIILEISKGSKFFENEERKSKIMRKRINELNKKIQEIESAEKNPLMIANEISLKRTVDDIVAKMESARCLEKTYVHIDMDAFFASVEERDNPNLKEIPVGVGGMGMLGTSNYVARKYGVRSGMPGFIAKKLCPELTIVKPNFKKYESASKECMEIFSQYDSDLRSMSLDEASMDVTNYLLLFPDMSNRDLAEEIQTKVLAKTRLTCSIGVGPTRMIAKMAAEVKKPNGVYEVKCTRRDILNFLEPLSCRKVPGIGKVTEEILRSIGIFTIKHIFEKRFTIYRVLSQKSFDFLLKASLGLQNIDDDMTEDSDSRERKSLGRERTFNDCSDPDRLLQKCHDICYSVSNSLKKNEIKAKTITLKLKETTFEVKQYSKRLQKYTDSFDEIYEVASTLLKQSFPITLRLMGVRVSNFNYEKDTLGMEKIDVLWKGKEGEERKRKRTEPPRCPICNKDLTGLNAISTNYHIDACLNVSNFKKSKKPQTEVVNICSYFEKK